MIPALRELKRFIDDIAEVSELNDINEKPELALLPVLYQRYLQAQKPDSRIIAFLNGYLATRYPKMARYLTTDGNSATTDANWKVVSEKLKRELATTKNESDSRYGSV